jgi:hypothetical protein
MSTMLATDATGITEDTHALTTFLPVPGYGHLAVNAFVVRAAQPMLIDTGMAAQGQGFLSSLRSVIDPAALRWIWLTHIDADHVGNLRLVLEHAPDARVVTNFIGLAKMGLQGLPTDRIYLLNAGQELDLGDRSMRAVRPPTYDAPETSGLADGLTGTFFSSDSFGALLHEPAESAATLPPEQLREGLITWSTLDAPWLHSTDRARFADHLRNLCEQKPARILSSHLPPAENMTETLCEWIQEACDAPPFFGPDQAALEAMTANA